jgi:hypothetical protein
MIRTIYNHIYSEYTEDNIIHRIVVQEMYYSQLEYLMKNTKRIRDKRWNEEKLLLVGIYKPSMSYNSHDITLVKIFKNAKENYFFEIHKTDKANQSVIRYRRWLLDIVPTV